MDGKKIQIRKMGSHQGFRDGKWYDVVNPRWDFDSCDYRVAPETKELKVVFKQCEKCGTFEVKEEARKPREWDLYVSDDGHVYDPMIAPYRLPVIKVREVIE